MTYVNSSTSGNHLINSLESIKESKWWHISLITGYLALLILGILASSGVLNGMGAANASYFSYGMYAGAALLFIAELVKLVIGCFQSCARENEETPESIDPVINNQINKVIISSACAQSYPCQHGVTILFVDGVSIKTHFCGTEAHLLIRAVERKKCVFDDTASSPAAGHFEEYASEVGEDTATRIFNELLAIKNLQKK